MQMTVPYTKQILSALAGTAVAAGALTGVFVAAGTASGQPANGPDNVPSCLEFVNPDGTSKPMPPGVEACAPVDIYAPGLTLAQRIAFVNPESPRYDAIVADLKAKYPE
ncbi:hypothetical protein [Gordonia aurantiaca]|uniref:hypothetical protein n=1 Tax=Gordonia sp. B21 TaxID=3151852 RepID=UPI0032646DAF